MNIWIINEYAGSPYHGMEYRHYYLGREFVNLGHNVTIISASYSHLFRKAPRVKNIFTLENIDGINYLWVKVPKYDKSTDKKRVLKWFLFSFYLLLLPFYKLSRPDVIILSPMATFPVLSTYILAKIFKAKFIFEIKDIWPLTLVEIGGYSYKNPLIILMKKLEIFGLKKADIIVSVLSNYMEYLKENKIEKDFIYIPNGISLKEMEEVENLEENIVNLIPRNKFIVGYVGTLGIANALDTLIKAAFILKENTDIAFVIVGDGSEKEKLIEMSEKLGLTYIVFIPSISKRKVQTLLKYFDVCYLGLRKKKIFYYGISPNKIFDYLYSGKPIIQSISTKNDIVENVQCGISVESENPALLAEAILKIKNMSFEDREKMGLRGRDYVIKNHDYEILAKKYLEVMK
ncbi:MAG: glycosyltransferase family 4 protein [Elusimicrobiota bacterium]|nr:glycosyltransferase family 4 protein [Endomicrobiia bacterium]MDW8166188.1 glycosyltransferase family 4 protein [Elusimicrobiota bacterium]